MKLSDEERRIIEERRQKTVKVTPYDHGKISKKTAAIEVLRYLYKIRLMAYISIAGLLVTLVLTVFNQVIGGLAAVGVCVYIGTQLKPVMENIVYLEKEYTKGEKVGNL